MRVASSSGQKEEQNCDKVGMFCCDYIACEAPVRQVGRDGPAPLDRQVWC